MFDNAWHLLKAIESIGKDLTTLGNTWQHLRRIELDRAWDLKTTVDWLDLSLSGANKWKHDLKPVHLFLGCSLSFSILLYLSLKDFLRHFEFPTIFISITKKKVQKCKSIISKPLETKPLWCCSSYPCPRKKSHELSRFYCKRSQLQKLSHLKFAAVLEEICSFYSMTWHVWNSFQTKIAHTLYRKRCNDVPQIQKLAKLGKPQVCPENVLHPCGPAFVWKEDTPKSMPPFKFINYTVCCAAVPSTSGQIMTNPYLWTV